MRKIAEEMLLDRRTVKKYLESDGNWNHASRGVKKKSKLDDYKDLVKKMYIEGVSSKEIYSKIKTQGYTGSESLMKKFITDFRSENIKRNEAVDIRYVERNDLISLLYKLIERVKTITLEELQVVLDRYEKYKIIFNIVMEFKEILFGEDSTRLNKWISKCKTLGIRKLNSLITGITRDIEAVENAITYEYSNGLAEGKINKIKVIKRIMYGRCSFETLRNRVLQIEYNT